MHIHQDIGLLTVVTSIDWEFFRVNWERESVIESNFAGVLCDGL